MASTRMARLLTRAIAVCAVAAMTGCKDEPALALHGLGPASESVADERLLGRWKVILDAPDVDTAEPVISPRRPPRDVFLDVRSRDDGPGAYRITITRGHRSEDLDAILFNVNGAHFLDCIRLDPYLREGVRPHYSPGHFFFRLEHLNGALTLAFLTRQWIEAEREAGRLQSPHTLVEGVPLLLGEPEELRAFLSTVANVGTAAEEAWSGMGARLERIE